ncbi:MAG TPA: hypothetical protein VJ385_01860 [Fibrobacteria bacterium]|nr:hypothetical protein [Fibrobacteria bacterium]
MLQSTALVGIAALFLTAPSWSAPKRNAAKPAVSRAPAETVYVPVTPPPAVPDREERAAEAAAARESENRRREAAASTGPLRNYSQAFGLYLGFYAAEILGSSPYASAFWDLYPESQPYFFQFTSGIGPSQSSISKSLVGGSYTPHSFILTFEALGGYSITGLSRGNGRSGGLFPYFVAGITAVWQGGIPNIGGVGGFGNRMNLPFGPKSSPYILNYAVHDHVYSQKFNSDPALTQNLALLLGVQKYF